MWVGSGGVLSKVAGYRGWSVKGVCLIQQQVAVDDRTAEIDKKIERGV